MPQALFQPHRAGALDLSHRIVLAPLTRNRATEPSLTPSSMHVEYYSQRATPGGLIITEATNISPEAMGYLSVPGIWTDEQVEAWRRVVEAIHAKGALCSMQLWHTGRISQPSFGKHPLAVNAEHKPSVSSSAVQMVHPGTGKPLRTVTYEGVEECIAPRELQTNEMARLVADYQRAAINAKAAGFDAVELHAAHGYLIDQFLQNGVNKRQDKYGGTVENRCRLLFEVVEVLCKVMGEGRVGVRLSPTTLVNGQQNQVYFAATCSDPDDVYECAVTGLNRFPLAYLLLSEPRWSGRSDNDPNTDKGFSEPLSNAKYRGLYKGTLIAAGGFTPSAAEDVVAAKTYDMIAFGRWFISNPDLPERIRLGSPLNVYDRSTFYDTAAKATGYTDYPNLTGTVGVSGKYSLMEQSQIGTSLSKSKL
eukprot:TRINITY_DN49647_c0_g1_i1.p1 TRINITY_DN49647_c0_g1~~TRINITY_DN49647_c0_g1_i1.p1  ORF type:complete len:420 (-),score=41.47 TRINITY_DN49647_c0_g1_i1:47-1306(-)